MKTEDEKREELAAKLIAIRHNLIELPGRRGEFELKFAFHLGQLRQQKDFVSYQAWHILRGSVLATSPGKNFDFKGELSVEKFLFDLAHANRVST